MVIIVAVLLAFAGVGVLAWVFMSLPGAKQKNVRSMMVSFAREQQQMLGGHQGGTLQPTDENFEEIERIKRLSGSAHVKRGGQDLEAKLFKAGYYTTTARSRFKTMRLVLPVVFGLAFYIGMVRLNGNSGLAMLVGSIGVFAGIVGPGAWVDREIRRREEDVMYFLPLVIEQVSIGVSSSLDVGPCLAQILSMADERDSHNPVTEMLVHVEKLIRSGLNLEDALFEVGEASGMTEVKHAFMFLAQCAKHGGEVSRQLQELADAVMVQRQVQVEGRIASLPVKATGPLAVVFAGFFALILAGLVVKLVGAFGPQPT